MTAWNIMEVTERAQTDIHHIVITTIEAVQNQLDTAHKDVSKGCIYHVFKFMENIRWSFSILKQCEDDLLFPQPLDNNKYQGSPLFFFRIVQNHTVLKTNINITL